MKKLYAVPQRPIDQIVLIKLLSKVFVFSLTCIAELFNFGQLFYTNSIFTIFGHLF